MAFVVIPAGTVMFVAMINVLREEVRYVRHDSIKARMRRFAAMEHARSPTDLPRR